MHDDEQSTLPHRIWLWSSHHRLSIPYASADITWPEYNQQCVDDAGPPYLDDEPGVKYHDGSGAWPVLLDDGTCADPLKEACSLRDDFKTAYLEGA